ncbi:Glucose-6-phosphate isomerase 2 [Alloalcanivorax dieselolei B5]|uniref:Glucose-6-phosphate isomerase n=1 Tax=Alcanivorax dieselolei (strain DSM 16502 / CGMCC 1.3690 / MCCC 1A00001 / B-5) TaxID=930169 RepID=K0CC03_ALCDB|nr:glucose-6-phosphate isomerase [Alloalcanivorax dieselolei]AFT70025.1 Glucose-6-phosphate isomerase 2 [Alloalcanivorax dieselolei B5]GGK09190.1 glucose-6-phosphate isomerase [Alloalcanivorax dieselolei]
MTVVLPLHDTLTARQAEHVVRQHAREAAQWQLTDLFGHDPGRFDHLSLQACGLLVDFSKQRITQETLSLLRALARERGLDRWIQCLFQGKEVNWTESRPAMHWRLREDAEQAPEVDAQLVLMERIVERLHSGQWRGCQGDAITDVVNIGVGGSDLGPLMASVALHEHYPAVGVRPRVHFVSSMDGSQIAPLLDELNPATTLMVVSSKSFTTVDTLSNAATARAWLERAFPDMNGAVPRCHFIGVSAQPERMTSWGIHPDNQLRLWDWVGGRYSLWSAIGLPIALTTGMDYFRELLAGAHDMDVHFRDTPWERNVPVTHGLVDVWNLNFLDITARAVLPYDGRLKHFPAYVEQLEMESNGKSVTRDGSTVTHHTCPVIWGEVGPNAQHAFYQLLHQGTQPVACEFIVAARHGRRNGNSAELQPLEDQHRLTVANCLAQSRLLALGESALPPNEPLPAFMHYRGNQPSTTIMLEALSPRQLGALVALYEHKVFVQAVLWGINPFDQWGVEMGKRIAKDMVKVLDTGEGAEGLDVSTASLADYVRQLQEN